MLFSLSTDLEMWAPLEHAKLSSQTKQICVYSLVQKKIMEDQVINTF